MLQGLRLNRLFGRALPFAAVLLLSLPAGAGAALPAGKADGALSPLLSELAEPAVANKGPAAQAEALGVTATGPASLVREGERVLVTARFDAGAVAALPDLRAAGARVVSASRDQQTVTLSVVPSALPGIAAVPGVRSVWQARQPVVYGVGEGSCEGGSVISEGLGQLNVDKARETFELRGKGITIGVLSDSYDMASKAADGSGPVATHAPEDVASNDLPGLASNCSEQQFPVDVLAEGNAKGADEGRAMLQILHDLAPHAKLAFATAFESEESFAQNIERLARPVSEGGAGADVIVDDVAWFEEPFFQDGPVAAAIDKVTSEGVTYLTAAGNDNLFDGSGHEIASWEAPAFRDSGACPEAIALKLVLNGKHCMDFDPEAGTDNTFGITVKAGATLVVDLQWAEPWEGVSTDLDAFLLSGGKVLAESAEDNVGLTGTHRPVEIVAWRNEATTARTVQLAINRFSGGNPRLKFILMENGGGVSATEYPSSNGGDVVGPTIFGHAGAASAISVAAVPYYNSASPESYSSRGPVIHLFGPVAGTTPAASLGSPEVIAKPDVAATDCGATTFFAFLSAGKWRFCGTSAAAPHAAAVAALLRQAKPSLPSQKFREALVETASPVGAFSANAVGGGLVNAFAALESLPGPLAGDDGPSTPTAPLAPPPSGSATVPAPGSPSGAPAVTPAVTAPSSPETTILRHPRKLVRTRSNTARVVFGFGSDQAGATFLCRIDKRAFRSCGSRLAHRFGLGRHALEVKAVDSAGLADPTPAVFRFRLEHVS
ncbi:MAG: S8 family serine peptidase [Solirubrobacterales bacterium]